MIYDIAKQMNDKLISVRRTLHKMPETAFEEVKTSQFIQNYLKELGIPFHVVAKTGVVGLIKGANEGKTILLRADIDGLPVTEQSDVEFKSEHEGFMHACGHDVHTTCLLGAAEILNNMKSELCGNVKIVFQPAEEGVGGALPMIEEGVMENPHVDACAAMHVEPFEKCGNIQIKDGAIMASPDDFELTVYGKGGHGAYPHLCVDPILIASMIVNAYQTIVSRHFDPMTPCVVSVCSFNSGTCTNVIPDKAVLTGTARSLDKETRAKLAYLLEKIAVDTAQSMGGTCDFKFKPLYPPTINDKHMNEVLIKSAKEITAINEVVRLETASMAGEDFAYFGEHAPSVYFKLGIGNEDESLNRPLHHSQFTVNENAIHIGAALMAETAYNYLKSSN